MGLGPLLGLGFMALSILYLVSIIAQERRRPREASPKRGIAKQRQRQAKTLPKKNSRRKKA